MWVEGGLRILCWTTGEPLTMESQNLPNSITHVDHVAVVGVELGLQLGLLHQCRGKLQTELPFSGMAA